MAQVVERPLWEREVPGSSPGAPILIMHAQEKNTFFVLHPATEFAVVLPSDGGMACQLPPRYTSSDFSKLVVSVAAENVSVQLATQVCVDGVWSKWYKLGFISKKEKYSFEPQTDKIATVSTDELQLFSAAQAYRVQLIFAQHPGEFTVAVSGVYESFSYDENDAAQLPSGAYCADITPRSQVETSHPDSRRICSPTSLCMALDALEIPVQLPGVLRGVFDTRANIYGNWIFNTAYACEQGAEAFFRRFSSLEEMAEFCAPGRFVIASISYEKDELPGAPMAKTDGHLVLIRGWKDGKILVADPAAETAATVLRAYDAEPFARAWLKNKQGASYILRKR